MTLSKHCTYILFSLWQHVSPIHTQHSYDCFVSQRIFDPYFKWIIWMLLQFRHGRCACNNELFNGMVKLEIVLKSRHSFALINNAKYCHIRGHLLSAYFFNLTRMTQVQVFIKAQLATAALGVLFSFYMAGIATSPLKLCQFGYLNETS